MKHLLLFGFALILLCSANIAFAAIGATHMTGNETETNGTSFTTASITPTANALELLMVASRIGGGDPASPTVTGDNLTWVAVTSTQAKLNAGHHEYRLTVFRALGASPSTGALTIDFSGVTQNNTGWQWDEFSGTDTSGSNGSGAVVQYCGINTTSTEASIYCSLSALQANSATYGASWWATGGTPTLTAGTGYTILGQNGGSISVGGTEWDNAGSTSVGITSNKTDGGVLLGIEIKAAAVASPTPTHVIRAIGRTRNNTSR